ncbi:MAG: 5-(carboxyamino)imidazole ribonucleotide mutase [Eubacteriaceae bacterium]|nr:5-(carboxyamino)imidazole ribonucleotide mutase [Eubacteriaceae bacterium]
MAKVAILMGSKSDYEVVKKAEEMLDKFQVPYDTRVISAHRSPGMLAEFAKDAVGKYDVIIAAAGKAAHLAGAIAGVCPQPVIGLPIKTSLAGGLDSLLSIVQMPTGVPVACVAIDGAANAAILAVQIIAVRDGLLAKAIVEYKQEMAEQTAKDDASLGSKPEERVSDGRQQQ